MVAYRFSWNLFISEKCKAVQSFKLPANSCKLQLRIPGKAWSYYAYCEISQQIPAGRNLGGVLYYYYIICPYKFSLQTFNSFTFKRVQWHVWSPTELCGLSSHLTKNMVSLSCYFFFIFKCFCELDPFFREDIVSLHFFKRILLCHRLLQYPTCLQLYHTPIGSALETLISSEWGAP